MTTHTIKLRVLSPLHIGNGIELRQGYDFVVRENTTYRLNEDAILQAKESRWMNIPAGQQYPYPGKLLDEADYETRGDFFRYAVRGAARSHKEDARLREFIKDVFNRPYIPGSSLKGAFRTALAWHGMKELNIRPDSSSIGRQKSWAGQPLERKVFGKDPNHDLLRALQVSDLRIEVPPPEKPAAGQSLLVVNAQVLTKRNQGSPIELEAIPGNTEFCGSLKIDESLFTTDADKIIHFNNRRSWLDELLPRAHAHSLARIEKLAEWFEEADNGESIAAFYERLKTIPVQANQAVLQIGWGAGWDGKTFWTHLQQDKQFFEGIVRDFRMHRGRPGMPPRKPGDPFPRSKRAAMVVKDRVARPAAPFGWVLVEVVAK